MRRMGPDCCVCSILKHQIRKYWSCSLNSRVARLTKMDFESHSEKKFRWCLKIITIRASNSCWSSLWLKKRTYTRTIFENSRAITISKMLAAATIKTLRTLKKDTIDKKSDTGLPSELELKSKTQGYRESLRSKLWKRKTWDGLGGQNI